MKIEGTFIRFEYTSRKFEDKCTTIEFEDASMKFEDTSI